MHDAARAMSAGELDTLVIMSERAILVVPSVACTVPAFSSPVGSDCLYINRS